MLEGCYRTYLIPGKTETSGYHSYLNLLSTNSLDGFCVVVNLLHFDEVFELSAES